MTTHLTTSTNYTWLWLLSDLTTQGQLTEPRGKKVLELLGHQTRYLTQCPIITVTSRKLGYKFMAAEAAWILSGDNRVSSIKPYSKDIVNYSDNEYNFNGSYGPKFIDQVSYVCDSLTKDRDTRQAVINIWRENPRPSKDIPCTLSLQFLIREHKLHCISTMRSSDAWLGVPYDVFNFSMICHFIRLMLREVYGVNYLPGTLTLNAGSQHLYEKDWDAAEKVVDKKNGLNPDWTPLDLTLVIDSLTGPQHLVDLLWKFADEDGALAGFLKLQKQLELELFV